MNSFFFFLILFKGVAFYSSFVVCQISQQPTLTSRYQMWMFVADTEVAYHSQLFFLLLFVMC